MARISASQAPKAVRRLAVLPSNVAIVRLFLAVQTQWVYAGHLGFPVALDYRAIEAVMNMLRVAARKRPRLLHGLRIMEAAALPVWQARLRKIR